MFALGMAGASLCHININSGLRAHVVKEED